MTTGIPSLTRVIRLKNKLAELKKPLNIHVNLVFQPPDTTPVTVEIQFMHEVGPARNSPKYPSTRFKYHGGRERAWCLRVLAEVSGSQHISSPRFLSSTDQCHPRFRLMRRSLSARRPMHRSLSARPWQEDIHALAKESHHLYTIARIGGRGLHSSTFQLNLSRVGHTSPCGPPV